MAAEGGLSNEIHDVTNCSICQERLKQPRQLPCTHTFCLHCLQSLFEDNSPGDEVPCPTCWKRFEIPSGGVKNLTYNISDLSENQLLEENQSESTTSDATDAGKMKHTMDDRVPYSDLRLLTPDPIGGGTFGAVYEALHIKWGCKVAYKKLSVQFIGDVSIREKLMITTLTNEAEIHRQQRHPNIVSMIGIVFEPANYGIVLEYVPYRALNGFLSILTGEAESSRAPCILKIKLAQEISSGMTYLHTRGILHCDLKLPNILLGEYLNAKISDFGLSKWKNISRTNTIIGFTGGTASHTAPEKWKDIDFRGDEKCDVYSFSILLWELFTEKKAFEESGDLVRDWVMSGGRLSLQHIPRDVPEIIHSVIVACWNQLPDKRPSFLEVKEKLDLLVSGTEQEKLIAEAKKEVIVAYQSIANGQEVRDHARKLRQFNQQLCELVRHTDEILSKLQAKRDITQREYELICSQPTDYESVNLLLKNLCKKDVAVYKNFLNALEETNQSYLSRLLEDKDYNLNLTHRAALLDNSTFLKENISVTGTVLLDKLLEADLLREHEVDMIKSGTTQYDKVHKLLHFMMRTSPEQYQLFLDALNQADNEHVYSRLAGNQYDVVEPEPAKKTLPLLNSAVEIRDVQQKKIIEKRPSIRLQKQERFDDTLQEATGEYEQQTEHEFQPSDNQQTAVMQTEAAELVLNPLQHDSRESISTSSDSSKDLQVTSFLNKAALHQVIKVTGYICGIAVVGNQLFVLRDSSSGKRGVISWLTKKIVASLSDNVLKVYDTNSFVHTHNLKIPGAKSIEAITSCAHNNCLYLSDAVQKSIYRYDLQSNNVIANWSVSGKRKDLSVTRSFNLLVTLEVENEIQEYKPSGDLIRKITLESAINRPQHCVQVSNEQFVVSYGGFKAEQCGVCVVDEHGSVIQSYGGRSNTSVGKLCDPGQVAIDRQGYVMVADYESARVELLSPSLTHIRYVEIPEHQLDTPWSLFLDELNHRLYVGDICGGRIIVLNF